jgi:adenylate cyclase
VAYDGGDVARGRAGLSILELSRLAGIPHTSLCSGRGRCGTCRVRIVDGAENLSAVNTLERGLLHGEAGPVRLACQARMLAGTATVERLIPVDADPTAVHAPTAWIAARHDPAGVQ